MTEIPEHLLKRAAAARDKSAAETPAPAEAAAAEPAAARAGRLAHPRTPAAAQPGGQGRKSGRRRRGRRRRRRRRRRRQGRRRRRRTAAAAAGIPVGAGPGGHTQRLLTVVKSGSIQDVKAAPVDKVHTWPHLLAAEFVAALACTAFVFIFSVFVNAPLLQLANTNQTPNPSKAPWYFLGLQELLTMFHPMVAGVTLPGVGLIALILAPFLDRNPSIKPEDRKFVISLMTVHMMFWSVLVIIGSFFRGPGFNFVLPWVDGLFFEL